MSSSDLYPVKIEPYSTDKMLISWSVGETYTLPYRDLRFHCPCAGCVNEHTGERMIQMKNISENVRCTGVELVGRYAMQMGWSDGHQTGMYHFDRLHHLCRHLGQRLH